MLLNHLPTEQQGCLGSLVSALGETIPDPPGGRTIDLLYRFLLDIEQPATAGIIATFAKRSRPALPVN